MFQFLVGAKLISADNNGFVVVQNGRKYRFEYRSDEGDCCGYNTITSTLLINDGDKEACNPIITKVSHTIIDDEYSQGCEITFFGLSKPIYTAAIESGSGSGWCYGATVKLTCKEGNFDKILTSW